MTIEFKIDGLKELGEQLSQFAPKLARRALARSAYAGAAVLRTKAREKATVIGLKDSGALVKSIRLKRKRARDWRTTAIYSCYHGSKGFYGQFYERGFDNPSGKRTQRPHLRPALDENTAEIIEAVRKRMAEEIEKLWPHKVSRF